MKTITLLSFLAAINTAAFATPHAVPNGSLPIRLEPLIVEASRLPTVQAITAAELETARAAFDAASREFAQREVADQLDGQVARKLSAPDRLPYEILPVAYRGPAPALDRLPRVL
jgi:hypothetical protein